MLTLLTAGDLFGPLVSYIKNKGLRFGEWKTTLQKVSKPGPALSAILALVRVKAAATCYAVRNGDLGASKSPEKMDVLATTLLAAYNILRFSTQRPGSGDDFRFTMDLVKTEKDGFYHGYHANDWFRAMYAIRFFLDRRRKNPIDVAVGQFSDLSNGFTLYTKSELDTSRMMKGNTTKYSQAMEITAYSNALAREHRSVPQSISKAFQETGTDRMIRRVTARTTYAMGLVSSISLSMQAKETIKARAARIRALGERYEEITPLHEQQTQDIIDHLRLTTPAGTVTSVKGKAVELFSNALGNDTIAHLDAHQSHEEAMLTIDAADKGETRHRALAEIRKLITNMAVASAMLDTLQEREMDWTEALRLLGIVFDELMADRTFDWSRIPIPGAAKDFRARAHQVVGAKAMYDLMMSPLRAGVLANEVGMGKTFSAILVIIMVYYTAIDRQTLNLPVDAGACLWITQAHLVVQTFREILTHFPGFFKIYVYYGNGQSDYAALEEATIPNAKELCHLVADLARRRNDPMVSNCL